MRLTDHILELVTNAPGPFALALIACGLLFRSRDPSRSRLTFYALVALLAGLVWTMVSTAVMHTDMLELSGYIPSEQPVPPIDQRVTAVSHRMTHAHAVMFGIIALLVPFATSSAVRRLQLELRVLSLAASILLALALFAAYRWAFTYYWFFGCHLMACMPAPGWSATNASQAWIDTARIAIVGGGVALSTLGVGCAWVHARRQHTPTLRTWIGLSVLLALGLAASWASQDERADVRDAPPYLRRGHALAEAHQSTEASAAPTHGPQLDHCHFDWVGETRSIDDESEHFQHSLDSHIDGFEICNEPHDQNPILARPEAPIEAIAPLLRHAQETGYPRSGVANLRTLEHQFETVPSFEATQVCVVDFTLDPSGVPLESFATWGELAAAADAAEGTLRISAGPPPGAQTGQ